MKTIDRIIMPAVIGLALALFGGCATTTTSGGTVGANRSQMMLISSEQLEQLAAESYAKLKTEAQQQGALNREQALLQRVRTITSRLIPQTGVFRADAPGWQWEVNVISSDSLNAFVMPGGKIMVYSGLVNQLHLSDAEIAIVLGHEIAHALREHSREQVSQAIGASTAIDISTALFGLGEGSANAASAGYSALLATRFSRTHESEADRIGLELSSRAGYDPRAGVSLWQKMSAADRGGSPPEFLSSHPTDASRVKEIQALLPTVLPLYETALARR